MKNISDDAFQLCETLIGIHNADMRARVKVAKAQLRINARDVVDWLLLLALLHCAYRVTDAIEAIAGAFS